ncbi:hypothetical protein [Novosphingobium olei]|nr:hypothetical protein NSDW_03060 [Novosphingobium olei]
MIDFGAKGPPDGAAPAHCSEARPVGDRERREGVTVGIRRK